MTTTMSIDSTKPLLTVPRAILWGGMVAGVLDAIDGVIAFGLKGMNPIQVLQYIASGALGKASFEGGLASAGLGVLLHFFIAFSVAAVYVLAARKIGLLKVHWVRFGLLFGALVYLFMTYLVVANSAVAAGPFSLALFLNGVIGHGLFVGLPIAFFAQRVAE